MSVWNCTPLFSLVNTNPNTNLTKSVLLFFAFLAAIVMLDYAYKVVID